MTRDELATYARHLLSMIANLQAASLRDAIEQANIRDLALRLVQAKGRFHTQKTFEDLREFLSPNAELIHGEKPPTKKNDVYEPTD